MTACEFLADLVSLAHAVYSSFVLFGWIIILVGLLLGWKWANGRRFRLLHLTATLLVVARVWIGLPCPFSVAEDNLRRQTSAPCPLGEPSHAILRRLAFRGTNPNRFAWTTSLFGAWVFAVHLGVYLVNRSRSPAHRFARDPLEAPATQNSSGS